MVPRTVAAIPLMLNCSPSALSVLRSRVTSSGVGAAGTKTMRSGPMLSGVSDASAGSREGAAATRAVSGGPRSNSSCTVLMIEVWSKGVPSGEVAMPSTAA
jgi:hypothetical protein